MIVRIAINAFVLLILLTIPQMLLAADTDHPHHLAVVGGFARNNSKDANFLGLEYEYRLNDKWGIGGYYEQTFNGFDIEALGLLGTYHPSGGWKVLGGIGVEGKLNSNKSKWLLRAGVGYGFHVGDTSITPLFVVDWIENNSSVVYLGVAVGFGF